MGGWVGSGIGSQLVSSLAYALNEPEKGSVIRAVGAAGRKAALSREWGSWGFWGGGILGAALGTWIFSYSDSFCYSYWKVWHAVSNWDKKDLETKDSVIVGVTSIGAIAIIVDLLIG